jgi:polar amino acid transport system substrate-binding protein
METQLNTQEYNTKKIRYISHEIKNQLSICDLYTEIIKRYCEKNNITDETLLKSTECIKNSIKMANNSLIELKSSDTTTLEKYDVNSLIKESLTLSNVYALNKNIRFYTKLESNSQIFVDKNKFLGVIINLVKNACEAFDDEIQDKNIIISTKDENGFVEIIVSNNAKPIPNPDDIFKEGFTTKSTGSGLGLYICKQNTEDFCGKFKLKKSDTNSTEFEILIHSVE